MSRNIFHPHVPPLDLRSEVKWNRHRSRLFNRSSRSFRNQLSHHRSRSKHHASLETIASFHCSQKIKIAWWTLKSTRVYLKVLNHLCHPKLSSKFQMTQHKLFQKKIRKPLMSKRWSKESFEASEKTLKTCSWRNTRNNFTDGIMPLSDKRPKSSSWSQSLAAAKNITSKMKRLSSSLFITLSLVNTNQTCLGSRIWLSQIFTSRCSRNIQAKLILKYFSAIKWYKDFGKVQASRIVRRS